MDGVDHDVAYSKRRATVAWDRSRQRHRRRSGNGERLCGGFACFVVTIDTSAVGSLVAARKASATPCVAAGGSRCDIGAHLVLAAAMKVINVCHMQAGFERRRGSKFASLGGIGIFSGNQKNEPLPHRIKPVRAQPTRYIRGHPLVTRAVRNEAGLNRSAMVNFDNEGGKHADYITKFRVVDS